MDYMPVGYAYMLYDIKRLQRVDRRDEGRDEL
jgi:hypothetical protein